MQHEKYTRLQSHSRGNSLEVDRESSSFSPQPHMASENVKILLINGVPRFSCSHSIVSQKKNKRLLVV